YGNIAPRTNSGKIVTILYAIVGIPLMLLYLTNIGDFLANSFKFVYSRIARRCIQRRRWPRVRRQRVKTQKSNAMGGCGDNKASDLEEIEAIKIDSISVNDHANNVRRGGGGSPTPPAGGNYDVDMDSIRVPISMCMLLLVGYIGMGATLFSVWEKWNYLDGSYFCFITLTTIGFGDLVPGDDVINNTGSEFKLVLCSLYMLFGMALLAMCFNLMQEEVINRMRQLAVSLGILQLETGTGDASRRENHT
ncbi:PREDICTED: potassium channel subfamily K member 18-like, partial [Priapulus caudatus]|uniref:Potassium channel subfamily K member 18-like n=1 Tax=Priapulus caudatus TaxID=37621 RepID=A0ABM1EHC5_PRICU